MEGDRDLLAELVDIFRAEYPRLLANLRRVRGERRCAEACRKRRTPSRARSATSAARPRPKPPRALEVMGQDGVLTGAGAGVARLEREVDELERNLVRMGDEAPA